MLPCTNEAVPQIGKRIFDAETQRRREKRGKETREKGLMLGSTLPPLPEVRTRSRGGFVSRCNLRPAAALKRIVHCYANPSLTPRVSASSALEPGEEDTLDISHPPRVFLCVSASEFTRRGRRNEVSGNTAYTPAPIITIANPGHVVAGR